MSAQENVLIYSNQYNYTTLEVTVGFSLVFEIYDISFFFVFLFLAFMLQLNHFQGYTKEH